MIHAQPIAHYCPGVEGLLAATAPPAGVYLRDYNVFYTSDRLNNGAGQNAGPANFNSFVYAQVPRLIWMTPAKFLGADVGVDALLPITYQQVTAGTFRSSTFGAGDLLMTSFLAWHPKQFDFLAGAGFWAPTGNSAAPPTTDAGMGYWGGMFTLGGTWYIDPDKNWALSLLNRYEINSEQRNTHITTGNAYTAEWGISKKIFHGIQVGAAGYFQQKTTSDSGPGATRTPDLVAAVGPEISGVIPKIEVLTSVRVLYEFAAEGRAQGETITLTLTKRF